MFGGIYRGLCTNNSDPGKLLRIRLLVPQVLGEAESAWAWPCLIPGWPQPLLPSIDDPNVVAQQTPAIGDSTWVMFEGGDPEKPVWMGVWRTNG